MVSSVQLKRAAIVRGDKGTVSESQVQKFDERKNTLDEFGIVVDVKSVDC